MPPIASTPAASPSRPSTKFTAFMAMTTVSTVKNVAIRVDPRIGMPAVGSW